MGAEYDHVYEAAEKGKEGELSFWIQRGGSVNRRNWGVRRRMCLAWAPASPPPLLLRSPSPPRQRPPCAVSPQPRRRWPFAAAPPSLSHPRVLAHSPRVLWHLMMTPVCLMCPARRIHSSHSGLMRRARRVRPTPHRVRGDRGRRHGCKPRACPPPQAHAISQLPCSDLVRLLPPVLRSTESQLCITRQPTATSRSPSVSSNVARIRRSETRTATLPSTWQERAWTVAGYPGRMARARSWLC
jgi:hypothetical protein